MKILSIKKSRQNETDLIFKVNSHTEAQKQADIINSYYPIWIASAVLDKLIIWEIY